MRETLVYYGKNDSIVIWPNGDIIPTHAEIDDIIAAFKALKSEWSPAEIERHNAKTIEAESKA